VFFQAQSISSSVLSGCQGFTARVITGDWVVLRTFRFGGTRHEMNSSNATGPVLAVSPGTGYLNALQVCAAILAMVVFGFFWRLLNRVGPTKELQVALNSYMFLVGIPTLVFQGLAVQKFSALPWSYVAGSYARSTRPLALTPRVSQFSSASVLHSFSSGA
jgi:hypothetical protein